MTFRLPVLFIILVVSGLLGESTVKATEVEGYLLEQSRIEGDGREGFTWLGTFRSDGRIVNVLIHYDTNLSEPTDYSYQAAKQDALVLIFPFEKKGDQVDLDYLPKMRLVIRLRNLALL